jgi:hypothetical protein
MATAIMVNFSLPQVTDVCHQAGYDDRSSEPGG